MQEARGTFEKWRRERRATLHEAVKQIDEQVRSQLLRWTPEKALDLLIEHPEWVTTVPKYPTTLDAIKDLTVDELVRRHLRAYLIDELSSGWL